MVHGPKTLTKTKSCCLILKKINIIIETTAMSYVQLSTEGRSKENIPLKVKGALSRSFSYFKVLTNNYIEIWNLALDWKDSTFLVNQKDNIKIWILPGKAICI